MAKKSEISYTEAMAEIGQILQALKAEELSVDELAKRVKRASELITICKERLKRAEEEVTHILEE